MQHNSDNILTGFAQRHHLEGLTLQSLQALNEGQTGNFLIAINPVDN